MAKKRRRLEQAKGELRRLFKRRARRDSR